jgi:hypothetical protein
MLATTGTSKRLIGWFSSRFQKTIEVHQMQSYFFDVVSVNGVQLDFHGHSLAHADDALRLAETIALDLESSDHEWTETQVVVRNDEGSRLYSVNVRHPDVIVW